ncbi:unnamed protein product [Coffea canephora]|uniref:Uncharacterized protein n=1 Tax=Coffea canephora TaxID=49390 RepID=A0A068U7H0_COFCA|nr:unnamed protein product [Coffea canephora]
MSGRTGSHQLSNGLYVSGRPEQLKERQPTMASRAVPYTGGDVKKSGELGKMYGIDFTAAAGDHHPHPHPHPHPSGAPPPLKPSSRHSSSSQHNSGSLRSGPNSGPLGQKSGNSGPMPPKRYTSSSSSFSGPVTPIQPTGLITSGPLATSAAGARSGRSGQLEPHAGPTTKPAYGSAVTSLSQDGRYGFRVSRAAMWVFFIVVVMGLVVGAFLMVAVKKSVILLAVAGVLAPVLVILLWNFAYKKRGLLGYLRRYPDAELRGAVDGQYVKVTGLDVLFVEVRRNSDISLVIGKKENDWLKTRSFKYIKNVRELIGLLMIGRDILHSFTKCLSINSNNLMFSLRGFFCSRVVTCGSIPLESSFQRVPRCVYTSTVLHEYRGWGGKSANAKHRFFSWGCRHSEKYVADFYISDFQSGLRALVKAGYGAKVTPLVKPTTVVDITKGNKELSPNFLRWLADRSLSSDDRIMRLREGYIKEGSTVSVMGTVSRHDNVLMIVPPTEPMSTGCQWTRCLLPTYVEGLVLTCDESQTADVIPV